MKYAHGRGITLYSQLMLRPTSRDLNDMGTSYNGKALGKLGESGMKNSPDMEVDERVELYLCDYHGGSM